MFSVAEELQEARGLVPCKFLHFAPHETKQGNSERKGKVKEARTHGAEMDWSRHDPTRAGPLQLKQNCPKFFPRFTPININIISFYKPLFPAPLFKNILCLGLWQLIAIAEMAAGSRDDATSNEQVTHQSRSNLKPEMSI